MKRQYFLSLFPGFIICLMTVSPAAGQFIEHFDGSASTRPAIPAGWSFATGDGTATMQFLQHDGHASAYVDARSDRRNIWWALIRRPIPDVDIDRLMKPEYELRVEARIKVSHAPRRVNLHFNHQRTTDFHAHLMEYDIPDTVNWHTISMTTRDFEVQPGDRINAQMALMDWGQEQYRMDIDYFRVDVVNRNTTGPDLGAKMPYHPPLPNPASFTRHVPVLHDAMIDAEYADLNFNDWRIKDQNGVGRLLAVDGTQIILLRWDVSAYRGKKVSGPGLLELTTHSVQRSPVYAKDFGMVRVVEILEGDPDWEQETVTYESFCAGQPLNRVLNTQMVIDYPIPENQGEKALFTINQSVLQRMVDGRTLGLAIRPLGAVNAAFYAMEEKQGRWSARLHFEAEDEDMNELREAIQKEFARSPGVFALAFQDLENPSRSLLINETESFHAASTMKTPVMIEVYKQAETGSFDLNDSLLVKTAFYSIVDSSIYHLEIGDDSEEKLYGRIGEKAGIYDLMVDMITYSSNLATNLIIDLVDAKKVTKTMRELGAPYIQVLRGVEDTKAYQLGMSNTTTAYDLMRIYEKIGRGEAVSAQASQAMVDILLDQHFNEVIPARLPPEVRVAHKTGWITQVRHDSGLVLLPDGRRYVLVLLSKGWESDELATEVMANVSKLIYDFYTGND